MLSQPQSAQTPLTRADPSRTEALTTDLPQESSLLRRYSSDSKILDRSIAIDEPSSNGDAALRKQIEQLTNAWREAEAKYTLRTQQLQVNNRASAHVSHNLADYGICCAQLYRKRRRSAKASGLKNPSSERRRERWSSSCRRAKRS